MGCNLLKELNVHLKFLCWECIDEEGLGDILCMGYGTMFECVMKLNLLIQPPSNTQFSYKSINKNTTMKAENTIKGVMNAKVH